MRRRALARLLAAVAALMLVPPFGASSAVSSEIVAAERYVVGGCSIRFDGDGRPAPVGTSERPCIGVLTAATGPTGDVVLTLTAPSTVPLVRVLASVDVGLARRGITVGASAARTIQLRLYDDRLGRHLDLRSSTDRSRVAGYAATISVGWVRAAESATDSVSFDPGYDTLGAYRDVATRDADTVQGGCVIRFDDGFPHVHANAAHLCIGVRSVDVTTTGRLRVVLSDEQVGSVVMAEGDPDETLTQRGIVMGVSGGLREFQFQLYDSRLNRPLNLTSSTDRARVAGSTANAWLTWTKTLNRAGVTNASADVAADKYGPYMNGSSVPGGVVQRGCTIAFSQVDGKPFAQESSTALCTGVTGVTITSFGAVRVFTHLGTDVLVSTTTVSSRSVTDYGIRAGLSGGGSASTYTLYSQRLGRRLDLTQRADRVVLQRSGSYLHVGWSTAQTGSTATL